MIINSFLNRFTAYKNFKKRVKKVLAKLYKFYTLRIMYPSLYRKNARKPVDKNKVVFIEVRMPEISDSFKLLYNELTEKYDFDVKTHFLRMSFVKRKEYRVLCKAMVEDIATAKYVFLNESSNITSCLPMRKDTVVTQLWHACGAFKKFGMSTAELKFGDDRKTLEKYPYHNNYTHVTVSSPEVIWAYEEAMSLDKKRGIVKATGTSRTDVFFKKETIEAAKEKLYKTCPYAKGKKVILYAPTFRGRVANAKTSDKLDVSLFYQYFKDEYVVLFKHHPFVKKRPVIPKEYKKFAMDVTDDMAIDELLCVSDVCISDYSSLVFEYSLFEKPMMFFAYDLDDYYDWRGFYYDYKDFVPGPIYKTNEEMIKYIKCLPETFDQKKVIDFKNKFMSSCDGHATERIMELVFGKELNKRNKKRG